MVCELSLDEFRQFDHRVYSGYVQVEYYIAGMQQWHSTGNASSDLLKALEKVQQADCRVHMGYAEV